jgi:hypothetical protein
MMQNVKPSMNFSAIQTPFIAIISKNKLERENYNLKESEQKDAKKFYLSFGKGSFKSCENL